LNLNFILGKFKKDIFIKYPLTMFFTYLATTLLIIHIRDFDNLSIYSFILGLFISVPLTGKIEGISNYKDSKFKKISKLILIVHSVGLSFYLRELSSNERLLTTFLLFISYLSSFFWLMIKFKIKQSIL